MGFRRVVFDRSGEPKVSDFVNHLAVLTGEEDVLGLYIPMDKFVSMDFPQAGKDVSADADGLVIGDDFLGFLDLFVEEVAHAAVLQHHEEVVFA